MACCATQFAEVKARHLLVELLRQALSGISEVRGTALDNSVMVYTSNNGEAHHSAKQRWPVAVLGNAGGRLKSSGAFRRFAPGSRSLADLWLTLAAALDVEAGDFAKGTRAIVQGPIAECVRRPIVITEYAAS